MPNFDFDALKRDLQRRMDNAVDILHTEFASLRTGRANTGLLEPINVDAYGSILPLNQVGTISVPEPRMLSINVWDTSLIQIVEKAIRDSDLGLNPQTEGQVIRIPIPALTEERRAELAKVAAKYSEDTRVAIRNVRRNGMDLTKKAERDGEISQDQLHDFDSIIQSITDQNISKVDESLSNKETEIMQV